MRSKNIFWGVLLVTIGLLFVLRNLDVVWFSWYSIFSLWPVFLIVLGISLLPIKSLVRILLAFLVIVLSLVYISNNRMENQYTFDVFPWFFSEDDSRQYDDPKDDDYEWRTQELVEEYDDDIENAVLNLEAIAGTFTLSNKTNSLLEFNREGNFGRYFLQADNAGSAVVLGLNMDSYIETNSSLKNMAEIRLHNAPVWVLNIDAGAAKIDFDLSPFKIDRLEIDGGASAIEIKMGDKFGYSDVNINAGATAVSIEVPKSSGCEVLTNVVLSSKKLDGFEKIESGVYRTENFNDASNKIVISVDAAISSLKVIRY